MRYGFGFRPCSSGLADRTLLTGLVRIWIRSGRKAAGREEKRGDASAEEGWWARGADSGAE